MKKLLIIGDSTSTFIVTQAIPLAKLFSTEYKIDILCSSPTSFTYSKHIPYFNDCLCLSKKDGKIKILETEEIKSMEPNCKVKDMKLLQYFDHFLNHDEDDLELQEGFKNKLEEYDKLLIIYDGDSYYMKSTIALIKESFKNKCFGRLHEWTNSCKPLDENKYIPKETVEAFGYTWNDELLEFNPIWFKDFDPNIKYNNFSVGLCCFSCCESKNPFLEDDTFFQSTKLQKILEKHGFNLYKNTRMNEPKKQIFYCMCKNFLTVDNFFYWVYRSINKKSPICFSPLTKQREIQLDTKRIIPNNINKLHELTAELIAELFIKQINHIKMF